MNSPVIVREKGVIDTSRPVAHEEVILRAKKAACEQIRQSRSQHTGKGKGKKIHHSIAPGQSVETVFVEQWDRIEQEGQRAEDDELFADSERLIHVVLKRLGESMALRDVSIEGRPAIELLAERLDALDWPEFFLVALFVINAPSVEAASERWLAAFNDSSQQEVSDD